MSKQNNNPLLIPTAITLLINTNSITQDKNSDLVIKAPMPIPCSDRDCKLA